MFSVFVPGLSNTLLQLTICFLSLSPACLIHLCNLQYVCCLCHRLVSPSMVAGLADHFLPYVVLFVTSPSLSPTIIVSPISELFFCMTVLPFILLHELLLIIVFKMCNYQYYVTYENTLTGPIVHNMLFCVPF